MRQSICGPLSLKIGSVFGICRNCLALPLRRFATISFLDYPHRFWYASPVYRFLCDSVTSGLP